MRRTAATFAAVMGIAVGSLTAAAARGGNAATGALDEVVVTASREQAPAGAPESASQGSVSAEQLENRPLLRPGEVLEVVPGLIVTQHSGDGKANQYFLRGFNLDHGTDFATRVDEVPVNMPTHAHGQGYSDLNFLIPELIEGIDYKKGVYYAEEGDFSAAGAADIHYRRSLDAPFVTLSAGQEAYRRVVLAASAPVAGGDVLFGGQYGRADGPWVLPEGYEQASVLVKYSRGDHSRGIAFEATGYDGHWHATDQIPLRAVAEGLISPFGYIDPTDGGKSHRWSVSGAAWSQLGAGVLRTQAYALDYHLDLFSDFTYFSDPAHGDQFEQYDNRHVYGGSMSYSLGAFRAGVQVRDDHIDPVALYDTTDRSRWKTVSVTQARVTNYAVYASEELHLAPWWRTQLGLRFDSDRFNVGANLPVNSGSSSASIASPKLAMVFGPWQRSEYFLDVGKGFHSNDARGTTLTVDPNDGVTAVSKVSPLVRAVGAEAGARSAAVPPLQLTAAIWTLRLDSELTLNEDASVIVPSGATRRNGVELGADYHPLEWVLIDADLAWTHARYVNAGAGGRYVPNAPERVGAVGVEFNRPSGWFGGARLRYRGASPLNETDAMRSRPSLQLYGEAGYRLGAQWCAVLSVYNLLDRRDYDIEYYYASRLRAEARPVNDLHVHPVGPRSLRMALSYQF